MDNVNRDFSEKHSEEKEKQYLKMIKKLLEENGFNHNLYDRNYLLKRINLRMHRLEIEKYEDYYNILSLSEDEELNILLKHIGLKITRFFRNYEVWVYLKEIIIPNLSKDEIGDVESINIWSAGCGNGAEAYSLSMIFTESYNKNSSIGTNFKIWASDYQKDTIQIAKTGKFYKIDLMEVPENYREKYFHIRNLQEKINNIHKNNNEHLGNTEKNTKIDEIYQITNQLKSKVNFFIHNLVDNSHFEDNSLSIIMCRYVLMFFDKSYRNMILKEFHRILKTDGILILGKTEISSDICNSGFKPMNKEFNIFKRE